MLAAAFFGAALLGLCAASASAQNAAGAPPASAAKIQFTNGDVVTLLKSVEAADKSPDIFISVIAKAAADMPAYDSIVHYAGIDPKTHAAVIWMVRDISKTEDAARALRAAMELACMDTGFAGPQWKSIYDRLAGDDSALPVSETNRYANRLRLTAQIQSIVDHYATKTPVP